MAAVGADLQTSATPAGKCEAFAALLGAPDRPQYDVAMMKFCYVDFEGITAADVEQMLACGSGLQGSALRPRSSGVDAAGRKWPTNPGPPGRDGCAPLDCGCRRALQFCCREMPVAVGI
jgi:hypothetical protein